MYIIHVVLITCKFQNNSMIRIATYYWNLLLKLITLDVGIYHGCWKLQLTWRMDLAVYPFMKYLLDDYLDTSHILQYIYQLVEPLRVILEVKMSNFVEANDIMGAQ